QPPGFFCFESVGAVCGSLSHGERAHPAVRPSRVRVRPYAADSVADTALMVRSDAQHRVSNHGRQTRSLILSRTRSEATSRVEGWRQALSILSPCGRGRLMTVRS